MIENTRLSEDLSSVIDSESKDFAVKAGRAQPRKKSFFLILFGTVWTAFTSIFVIAFLGPLFLGKEVHFESNGVPTVASPDNLSPIIVPALIIGFLCISWYWYVIMGNLLNVQKRRLFCGHTNEISTLP